MSTIETIKSDLYTRYNKSALSKKELAEELGLGLSTVSLRIKEGYGLPNYIKNGDKSASRIIFPLHDVAEFLANTTKVQ